MTAEPPVQRPLPRRLLEDEASAAPASSPTAAPPAGTVPTDNGAGVAVSEAEAAEIATLDAPPPVVVGVPDDPRTGEPRRPAVVAAATVACWLAVAVTGASLLWVYWDAVPPDRFAQASWLMGQFATEPGSLGRVLLAIAVTVIALTIGSTNAIVGYYAWMGYRWTRIAGLISAALSFGALTLNPLAWAVPALAVLGAGLLWLPAAGRFFTAWDARRHPAAEFAPPVTDVYYGPLPRYR